ncbi:transforming growth factor-beta-induced protein ig-h3-like [Ptychodera flava]|uniref:transforming growth factor-beta-induced protein ig-h3-like n=1 Tax=Ptychodera flava TaxID=63121 RepID=UPI003969DD43
METTVILFLCLGAVLATDDMLKEKLGSAMGIDDTLNDNRFTSDLNVLEVANMLGASEYVRTIVIDGLDTPLTGKGPFTLFAPINREYVTQDPWLCHYYRLNIPAMKDFVDHHTLPGIVMSSSLGNDDLLKPLKGNPLRANIYQTGSTVVTIDGVVVSSADHLASNGVVHLIDGILHSSVNHSTGWVVDNRSQFSTLRTALKTAGMQSALKGPGPFTVFAPSNAAFEQLPPGVLDSLLKNPSLLEDVLKFHIVNGTYFLPGIPEGSLLTQSGQNLQFHTVSDVVEVQGTPLQDQTATSNGVVYLIESVLRPYQPDPYQFLNDLNF